jgi:photosystem II stability/assembly factor-like uncharacterized protein
VKKCPHLFELPSLTILVVLSLIPDASALRAEPELIPLGPFGGDVRSLAHHPQRPDDLYLGTTDGQVFLSGDGGENWEKLSPGLNRRGLVIDSLVFHPDDADTLYAGGWELKSDRGEMFVTHDGGRRWTKVDLGRYQSSIRAIAISASDPNHIVVGISEGVVASRDGGLTWDRISRGYRSLHNVESLAFHPSDEKMLYVGTWRLAWRTPDLGKTWERTQRGMYWDSHVFSLQIDPEDPDTLFAGACSGVYRSVNGGLQWTKLKNGLPKKAKRTRVLHLDPNDSDTIYAGSTVGLYRSTNGGTKWKLLLDDVTVNTILVNPENSHTVLIGTDDAGVLKSVDAGVTFLPVNRGFSQRQVGALVARSGAAEILYASVVLDRHFGGFFLSKNQGRTWKAFNKGLEDAVSEIAVILPSISSKEVFLGTRQGLFIGVPEEKAWQPAEGTEHWIIRDLEHSVAGKREIFVATSQGLFELDLEEGRLVKHKLPAYDDEITSLLVDTGRVRRVFVGTHVGVFLSENRGKSWILKTTGLPRTSVNALERSGARLFCGTRKGLFLSDDNGDSWSPAQGGFPLEISSIKANPSVPDQVFAADMALGYFFMSRDNGSNWEVVDLGPAVSRISSLAFTSSGKLLAGTRAEGVFRIVPRGQPDPASAAASRFPPRTGPSSSQLLH